MRRIAGLLEEDIMALEDPPRWPPRARGTEYVPRRFPVWKVITDQEQYDEDKAIWDSLYKKAGPYVRHVMNSWVTENLRLHKQPYQLTIREIRLIQEDTKFEWYNIINDLEFTTIWAQDLDDEEMAQIADDIEFAIQQLKSDF